MLVKLNAYIICYKGFILVVNDQPPTITSVSRMVSCDINCDNDGTRCEMKRQEYTPASANCMFCIRRRNVLVSTIVCRRGDRGDILSSLCFLKAKYMSDELSSR